MYSGGHAADTPPLHLAIDGVDTVFVSEPYAGDHRDLVAAGDRVELHVVIKHVVIPGVVSEVPGKAQGLERVRVEFQRAWRLGGHEVTLAEARDIDVRLEVGIGVEDAQQPFTQPAAGIGAHRDRGTIAPLARVTKARGLQETIGIGHPAFREAEHVQHPQTVKPVAKRTLPGLELGRHSPHEAATQPRRKRAPGREVFDGDLLFERSEPLQPCSCVRVRLAYECSGWWLLTRIGHDIAPPERRAGC